MFKSISLLFVFFSFFTFGQEKREIMYRIHEGETAENCGYMNEYGDTLFPIGTFPYCFSDSMDFAIVETFDGKEGFLTIDSKGNELFRVFTYDNGPDYIEDGTFRIIKDGKIGYATEDGTVIIPPLYEAAWPFENSRAQVSIKATKIQDGEHWFWIEDAPFIIDKSGNRHNNQER